MKNKVRHPLSPLLAAFWIASLALPPPSAFALRASSTAQSSGLEELADQLAAPFKSSANAGLEEGGEERSHGRLPVVGAEAIAVALRRTAQAAFSGKALPNMTGVTKLDATGQNLLVWHDSSEADSFGGTGMMILGGMPRPMPLTPAPGSLRSQPRVAASARYQARFTGLKAFGEVEDRHPELRELVRQTNETVGNLARRQERPRRRWVKQTSELAKKMAERQDDILKRWRASEPGPANDLLEKIRQFHLQHQLLERTIQQTTVPLRQSAEAGQVPAARVREILGSLREVLELWPRTQMAVDQHRVRLSEGSVELQPFLELVEDSTREAVRQQEWILLLSTIPPGQREVLHDAYRSVWLERLRQLEGDAESMPVDELEGAVLESHRIARWLAQLEWNAGMTRHLGEMVRNDPPGEEERVTSFIVQAGGVLLIGPDGRARRFVPGGGAIYTGGDLAPRYFPFGIQGWFQPGDQVALLYPSITGSPSIEHLGFYTEDWFLLRQMLPGAPEIWLGTLTADGALRVYRPREAPAGKDGWRLASDTVAGELDRYDWLRYLLQEKLYTPPPEVSAGHEAAERTIRQAKEIARALGKRTPRRSVIRKATAGIDPLFRWLKGMAQGGMLRLFQEGLGEGYGALTADLLLNEIRTRFREPLAELAEPKKILEELNQQVPALAQQMQMIVAERIGDTLLSKEPFLELVEVEGIGVMAPPSFNPPAQPEEAGAAPPAQEDLESAAASTAADFLIRSKIAENQNRFFKAASEAEIEAFARQWVMKRLQAGERGMPFVTFSKDFLAERNRPKPPEPTPEDLTRQAAEGMRDQLNAQLAQIPSRLGSRNEVEQAQVMIAELDRQLPALEAVPELSSDAERLRAGQRKLGASIEQAQRRLEREERGAIRAQNDQIIQTSQSTRAIATVLLTDDRFLPLAQRDGEIHLFIRKASEGDRPVSLARAVQTHLSQWDLRKRGDFEIRFHQALLKLTDLVISSGEQAGLEEPSAWSVLIDRLWVIREGPVLNRLRTDSSFDRRVEAAEHLHQRGAFVPPAAMRILEELPTGGAQQAAMMHIYRYRRGRITQENLLGEMERLRRWEEEAEREKGPQRLIGLEVHTAIAETGLHGLNAQRFFNLMMRVPSNFDGERHLRVETIFEEDGLEIQTLPSHSPEVQSAIWDLWETVSQEEGFPLVFGRQDGWVHMSFNGMVAGLGRETLLFRWVEVGAEFAKKEGVDMTPEPTRGMYVIWFARDPRRSALGGWRTEVTGRVYVGNPTPNAWSVGIPASQIREYRLRLFQSLDRLGDAYQERRENPEFWVRETADLPPRLVRETALLPQTGYGIEKREQTLQEFYAGRVAGFPGPGEGGESLGRLSQVFSERGIRLSWEPVIEQDPALFGQATRLLQDPDGVETLLRDGRYGWGLELRRDGAQAELLAPPAGLEPFIAYQDFVQRYLRPRVESVSSPALLLREEGVYLLDVRTGLWELIDNLWMPDGLGAFFRDRKHLALVLMLPAAAAPGREQWWQDLARRLDPRALRQEIPYEVGVSTPTWGYVGRSIRHPKSGKQAPVSFIVKTPASAGLEEVGEEEVAALRKQALEGSLPWRRTNAVRWLARIAESNPARVASILEEVVERETSPQVLRPARWALRKIRAERAGLEEVKSAPMTQFEKNPALGDAQYEQIEQAKKNGALYATVMALPSSFTLYAQGKNLTDIAKQSLRAPEGVRMPIEQIFETIQEWDELGFVLENNMLGFRAYNPRGLPHRGVWPVDVPQINPMEFLAEVMARQLGVWDKGGIVGQMIYQDSDGARLVLFSREA